MLLSELLAGMGHDVCSTAATEAEAVSAATRYDPDLMIVDARLGRGSGVSAVEEILRAGAVAHVFVSTMASSRERRCSALVAGFLPNVDQTRTVGPARACRQETVVRRRP
jgi:DNA-binding response OmpR family regulator